MAQTLREVVRQGLEAQVFPGAVLHVQRDGELLLFEAFGQAAVQPARREMHRDTIFDVASLTKVMATLPAAIRTLQTGKLNLHTPIRDYLPEWRRPVVGPPRSAVTLHHLLTHTSGLPAWRPFYLNARTAKHPPDRMVELICSEPLEQAPGTRVVYSDPGMILVGRLLETVWGKPFADICCELVFEPLGLANTSYLPSREKDASFASTELGNAHEHKMCREYAATCAGGSGYQVTAAEVEAFPWRTEILCGEVHDGNCHYGMQGVSGHAGLFSTAEDVARYFDVWRNKGLVDGREFLNPRWVQLATTNQTPTLNIARGLGFEIAPDPQSEQAQAGCTAGPAASSGAYGHTGFTGTSIWYDPRTRTQVVALTNRVHPVVKDGMIPWRRLLHEVAF